MSFDEQGPSVRIPQRWREKIYSSITGGERDRMNPTSGEEVRTRLIQKLEMCLFNRGSFPLTSDIHFGLRQLVNGCLLYTSDAADEMD